MTFHSKRVFSCSLLLLSFLFIFVETTSFLNSFHVYIFESNLSFPNRSRAFILPFVQNFSLLAALYFLASVDCLLERFHVAIKGLEVVSSGFLWIAVFSVFKFFKVTEYLFYFFILLLLFIFPGFLGSGLFGKCF